MLQHYARKFAFSNRIMQYDRLNLDLDSVTKEKGLEQ